MRRLLLPLLLLTAAPLTACNPCAERCRAESNHIEDCLHDWGLEWADLDADDRIDYRTSCVEAEQQFDAGLDPQTRRAERALCQDVVNDLRLATSCDEVWDALISYGAE